METAKLHLGVGLSKDDFRDELTRKGVFTQGVEKVSKIDEVEIRELHERTCTIRINFLSRAGKAQLEHLVAENNWKLRMEQNGKADMSEA